MRSSKNRVVFSKSQPRGRKRSWPTRRWLSIQTTSDTSVSWANTHGVHSPAKNSHHRRRSHRSAVRHWRFEGHAGPRCRRFRNRPASQPARLSMFCIRMDASIARQSRSWMGLDRFEAREKAAELLQGRGALAKREPYENNVGFSDRSDVPIEPRISEQWFMRYPKTKEALADCARSSHPLLSRALGKEFTRSGWRTSATGASAGRCGGDIGYRPGIA